MKKSKKKNKKKDISKPEVNTVKKEKTEKPEKKGFIKEFKEFIAKGNAMTLAVGVIIGSAFTAITSSLVNDILMPVISLVALKGFNSMYLPLFKLNEVAPEGGVTLANGAIIAAGEPIYRTYIYYGNFIKAILNFLLVALVLFFIVKFVNKINAGIEKVKEDVKANINKKENEENN